MEKDNANTDNASTEEVPVVNDSEATVENNTDASTTETSKNILDSANQNQVNASESTDTSEQAWYDSLSDEVKGLEGFEGVKEKFKDVDSLAASYINLQKHLGKKADTGIPDENASDEERAEFYNKLGRPEKPSDYEWENKSEDFQFDSERLTERNQQLHDAGITNDQYNKIMDIYAQEVDLMQGEWQQNEAEVINETKEALTKEWGDKYDENIKHASKVAEKFGVKDALVESGVINHKPVIEMLYKVYEATTEDGIVKDDNEGYSRTEEINLLKNQMKSLPRGSREYKQAWDKYIKLIG